MRRLALLVLLSFATVAPAQPAVPVQSPSTQPADDAFRYVTAIEPLDENGLPARVLRLEVVVIGDVALVPDGGGNVAMTFHLNERRVSGNRGNPGTYDELLARAKENRTKTLASLGAFADPKRAEIIKYMAEPDFKVDQQGQTLKLSNEIATYEIQLAPLTPGQSKRLHLIDRLQNLAYLDPNQPPFAALAVADELEKRQSYAKEIRLRMRSGDRFENILVRSLILPLTPELRKQIEPLIPPK